MRLALPLSEETAMEPALIERLQRATGIKRIEPCASSCGCARSLLASRCALYRLQRLRCAAAIMLLPIFDRGPVLKPHDCDNGRWADRLIFAPTN